jgi:hypothetical protein
LAPINKTKFDPKKCEFGGKNVPTVQILDTKCPNISQNTIWKAPKAKVFMVRNVRNGGKIPCYEI